ncbi:MAG: hydrogenase 2 operon protein HybA [Verrucomicrobiota bacterium]
MNDYSRRAFLKSVTAAGTGWITAGQPTAASAGHSPNNKELGLLYDATRCIGCKACMAACKRVNAGAGALGYEQARFDPDGLWDAPTDLSGSTRTIIKLARDGSRRWSFIKQSCLHCQRPSCVSVCPVKAMTKDPVTGIVDYRKSICIGCRYCQIACPFNVPKFQWDRTVPRIVKCDLCRTTNLREKTQPACAEVCPTGAIAFGRRGALLQEAAGRLAKYPSRYVPHVYGEHEGGGTNVLFLAAVPFELLGLPRLGPSSPAELSETVQHTIYKGLIAPAALLLAVGLVAYRNQKGRGHSRAMASSPRNKTAR